MKKFLSLFLAVVMVIGVAAMAIPMTFAAGNTTEGAEDAYFKIGDQYYSSLKAALEGAADGDVIDMVKNYDDPATAYLCDVTKSLTINGNGYKYTAKNNTNKYMFYVKGGNTVTMNGMNMEVQSGFGIVEGVINLNNCTILSTHRMAIRTSGATKVEFNLHNTTIEINSNTNKDGAQAEPPVYLDGSDYNILNLTGTSKIIRSTKTTGNTGNCSVVNVVSAAGYTEINVGPQAEIVLNQATGNANAPHGIYNGGKGLVVVNLAKGSTMRIDSAIDNTPYFFYGAAALGFAINDEGCNFLVKSGKTPGQYLSGFNVWESVTSPVSGYTAFKVITPVATADDAIEAINAGNVIRYYNGGVKYTNNIKTAVDGAADGSVIHVLGNFTQTSANALCNVTKKVSFSGYGHTLTFNNNNAGGTFPLTFDANSAMANFSKIITTTGVINVKKGTVAFTNVDVESGNRAALKFTGGAGNTAYIMLKDAVIATGVNTGDTEAPVIIEGNGNVTFRLRDGGIFRRNNKTKGNIETQAAVVYTGQACNGNYTINMEAGSMITTNAASGNAKASVLAFDAKGAVITVNVAEGAYIASESSNITNLTFIYNNSQTSVKVNAPAGAFIANSTAAPTVQAYLASGAYVNKSVAFAEETSTLDGYKQYSMGEIPTETEFFMYTNAFGEDIPVSFSSALTSISYGATVKLRADRTFGDNGKSVTASKKLTIDLNGHTLTNTAESYVFSVIDGNLTIKNGTFNLRRGLVVTNNGILNLDGVTGAASQRPYIKLNSGKATANINNSTITQTANGENLILIENLTVGTLNVTGASYLAHKGASGGGTNSAVVQIMGSASATITVGAGSKLSSAYEINSAKWGGVIVDSSTGNVSVTLEAGSELAIERKYAPEYAHFIYERTADGTTKVYDNGATYTVSAESLNSKIFFPKNNTEGKTFVGFVASNGKLYNTGEAVIGGTEAITFTAAYMADGAYDIIDGASLRTVAGENGLRFTTYVSDELLALLAKADAVEFHTLIAKNELLAGAELTKELATGDDAAIAVDKMSDLAKINKGFVDNDITYENAMHVAILLNNADIEDVKLYTIELAARGYFTVTYANGSTATFYTDFDDNNVRSMYDVANALKDKPAYVENAVVQGVVEAVNAANAA